MVNSTVGKLVCAGTAALMLTACENLPGSRGTQGAVIGGAAGAATGAAVAGSGHRGLGAVLGGLLGAGGGYVIGAQTDKVKKQDSAGANRAMQSAQAHPATAAQAQSATTADLNGDGFVTLDEVLAMKNAGFSDQKMVDMMRATGQVFDLTPDQQSYLRSQGVSDNVISQMASLNQTGNPGATYPGTTTYPPTTYPPTTYPGATVPTVPPPGVPTQPQVVPPPPPPPTPPSGVISQPPPPPPPPSTVPPQ